jgi:hypothetical protein
MKISLPTSLGLVAVGAVMATVPFATPAQAATTQTATTQPAAAQPAAAPPPACATLTKNATATVLTVQNNCSTAVRLRVIVSPTVITSCSLYAPGAVRVFTVPSGAPSARLETC